MIFNDKNKHKYLLTSLSAIAVSMGTACLTNHLIFKANTHKHLLAAPNHETYSWRFGEVKYTCQGTGSPVLFVHELSSYNCDDEWRFLVAQLALTHTVYTIDLLGCGRSEKPSLTYTNFLYVQLLNDFIKNVIHQRTDIITSGNSSSLAIISCHYESDLFNKLIFINPESTQSSCKIPHRGKKLKKKLLNSYILGTSIYNILHRRKRLLHKNSKLIAKGQDGITINEMKRHSECAHTGSPSARFFYSSLSCNYIKIPIRSIIPQINNSIYLIGGCEEADIEQTFAEFQELNPSIEYEYVNCSKHYPHIENPQEVLELLDIYL